MVNGRRTTGNFHNEVVILIFPGVSFIYLFIYMVRYLIRKGVKRGWKRNDLGKKMFLAFHDERWTFVLVWIHGHPLGSPNNSIITKFKCFL